MTILFDSTEIWNSTYIPQYLKHESMPERILNYEQLASGNGAILIREKFGIKKIQCKGIITGTSAANLEVNMDTFKELMSRKAKNLEVTWSTGTRKYVTTCSNLIIDRDFFHLLFAPWSAEFISFDGIGVATEQIFLDSSVTFTNIWTGTWTFAGSAPPLPWVVVNPDATLSTALGFEIKNIDNGHRIIVPIPGGLVHDGYVELFFDTKKIQKSSGVYLTKYYGQWPDLKVGVNNIRATLGNVIDQGWEGTIDDVVAIYNGGSATKAAQSFTVENSETTYKNIYAYLTKVSSPTGNYIFSIVEDDDGDPTGAVIVTANVNSATFPSPAAWFAIYTGAAVFNLTSGKIYWIILDSNGQGDVTNHVYWNYSKDSNALYKRGHAAYYNGAAWVHMQNWNLRFRVCFMGGTGGQGTVQPNYYRRYL